VYSIVLAFVTIMRSIPSLITDSLEGVLTIPRSTVLLELSENLRYLKGTFHT